MKTLIEVEQSIHDIWLLIFKIHQATFYVLRTLEPNDRRIWHYLHYVVLRFILWSLISVTVRYLLMTIIILLTSPWSISFCLNIHVGLRIHILIFTLFLESKSKQVRDKNGKYIKLFTICHVIFSWRILKTCLRITICR